MLKKLKNHFKYAIILMVVLNSINLYGQTFEGYQGKKDSLGLKQGVWKKYYKGKLESQIEFRNDSLINKAYWYYPSGKPATIGNFKRGLKDGDFNYFSENGKLIRTISFIQGRMKYIKKFSSGEIVYFEEFDSTGKTIKLIVNQEDFKVKTD